MPELTVNLDNRSYNIIIERGALNKASELLKLDRKVLVVTDSGVPAKYAESLAAQCKFPYKVIVPQGEGSKTIQNFEKLCREMMEHEFTRGDCVAAVGGGVVGDLAGFAAACYMRGIDFYDIPTTVLSQVDSSIGGKTAVDLDSIKNIIGAFKQPEKVIIDADLLYTLPQRQISNGLAEALKMALTFDEELFELFENRDISENLDKIIYRSLELKKAVVEEDEKEAGLRKVLNFGHTAGHGIESLGGLYHGECVALGMLPVCSESVKKRLVAVLKKLNLPTEINIDVGKVLSAVCHDKKAGNGYITIIFVEEPGSFVMKNVTVSDFGVMLKEAYK